MGPYIGRAFLGDGVATMVSAAVAARRHDPHAENIGVMAATRIYSTALCSSSLPCSPSCWASRPSSAR
jgi:xanthine/uracil permease